MSGYRTPESGRARAAAMGARADIAAATRVVARRALDGLDTTPQDVMHIAMLAARYQNGTISTAGPDAARDMANARAYASLLLRRVMQERPSLAKRVSLT